MQTLIVQGEALVEMLAQLARLCNAGVGHLLDARDAHDSHAACLKDAARVGVSLSRQEEVLANAEARWVTLGIRLRPLGIPVVDTP